MKELELVDIRRAQVRLRSKGYSQPNGQVPPLESQAEVQIPQLENMPELESSNPSPNLLQVTTMDSRFSLITPRSCPIPKDFQSEITRSAKRLKEWLLALPTGQVLAMDWETQGTQIFGSKTFRGVGLSFAHRGAGIYIDTSAHSHANISGLITHIRAICKTKRLRLVAHNLYFDSSVMAHYSPTPIREANSYFWDDGSYLMCTYLMLRYLASEGFEGQMWGLKWAQKEIMGWEETNEVERDEWLIRNGYITIQNSAANDSDTLEERRVKLEKIEKGLRYGKVYKVNKAEMWRCPAEILGRYCILDSLSTLLLYEDILLPAFKRYETPFYKFFLYEVAMEWIRGGTAGFQDGIEIDLKGVRAYGETLKIEIDKLNRKLYREYKVDIALINKRLLDKYDSEHAKMQQFLSKKPIGKEPTKYRKDGKLSRSWLTYTVREKRINKTPPEISKLWMKYRGNRKLLIRDGRDYDRSQFSRFEGYLFNPNSSDHKRDIIYRNAKYTFEYDNKGRKFLKLSSGVELELTDSGKLPTDKAAVIAVCGEGSIWNQINKKVKALQFVTALIERVEGNPSHRLYASMVYPGTLTNRASGGGGINIQNPPKDPEFLKHWKADEGWFINDSDLSGIEPHVLAESSHDENLMFLYGPGAPKNDIYLYNGVLLGGEIAEAFTTCGYQMKSPLKDAMDLCKKKHKGLRNVSKLNTLCIAEGTLIRVKDKGVLPIERITDKDMVWDGDEWITTSGAVYSGEKDVILFEDVYMTKEHNILTMEGWRHAGELFNQISEGTEASQCIRPKQPSASWADVWAMGSYIIRSLLKRKLSVCKGTMLRMWDRGR